MTINTPLASAGPMPSRLSKKGIETPAIDEARMLINIDAPTINPIFHVVLKNKTARTETIIDQKTPFTKATRNSLDNNLKAFEDWILPIATPLITNMRVWFPATPPILATIGIKTAKATTFSIDA